MLFRCSSKINPKFKLAVFNTSKENDYEIKRTKRSSSLVQLDNVGRDREKRGMLNQKLLVLYIVVAVTLSGILKAKHKLAVTFNSDKHDIIDFTKFQR